MKRSLPLNVASLLGVGAAIVIVFVILFWSEMATEFYLYQLRSPGQLSTLIENPEGSPQRAAVTRYLNTDAGIKEFSTLFFSELFTSISTVGHRESLELFLSELDAIPDTFFSDDKFKSGLKGIFYIGEHYVGYYRSGYNGRIPGHKILNFSNWKFFDEHIPIRLRAIKEVLPTLSNHELILPIHKTIQMLVLPEETGIILYGDNGPDKKLDAGHLCLMRLNPSSK